MNIPCKPTKPTHPGPFRAPLPFFGLFLSLSHRQTITALRRKDPLPPERFVAKTSFCSLDPRHFFFSFSDFCGPLFQTRFFFPSQTPSMSFYRDRVRAFVSASSLLFFTSPPFFLRTADYAIWTAPQLRKGGPVIVTGKRYCSCPVPPPPSSFLRVVVPSFNLPVFSGIYVSSKIFFPPPCSVFPPLTPPYLFFCVRASQLGCRYFYPPLCNNPLLCCLFFFSGSSLISL